MGKILFEIGAEEIPARFIPSAINQIEENFKRITSEYRIDLKSLNVYATPRRLTLIAEVSSEQASEEKLIWGPPVHIAFDEQGMPKEPAYAFAKAQGIDVEHLKIKPKGKGNYVCAVLSEQVKKTEEVLPEILENFFYSLNFPKMMRWGKKTLRFIRPVRWFLVLYENRLVSFEIEGIKTDNKTQGHRFLAENPLHIDRIDNYEKTLEKAFVIVDPEKRKRIITTQAEELAKKVDGKILWNNELLEEVTHLVEFPSSVLCSFSKEYLKLPEELLITVMKDHQRYFAIIDNKGKLKNYFVVVSNTVAENEENIRKGAERVIRARFEDAKFYYEEDLKKGLESLLEATKGIIYHEKLGSLYDKSLRIMKIAERLSDRLIPEKKELVKSAAKYCKADLASGVIGEFPELQGIMGGYYSKKAGLQDEVSVAIKEHYIPKGFTDEIPSNDVGCIISLADKLDHMATFFYLGEIPSGTEDPFGLRRVANGIISILLRKKYPLSLLETVGMIEEFVDEKIKEQISVFIVQRFESYLELSRYDVNLIKTINNFILIRPVYEIEKRLEALSLFRKKEDFEDFFLAVKRVSNIIKNYKKFELNPELFFSEEEKKLYEEIEKIKLNFYNCLNSECFFEALNYLHKLTPTINNFFDKVLVMDKDEKIKRNRLALLQYLSELLKSVADISRLY